MDRNETFQLFTEFIVADNVVNGHPIDSMYFKRKGDKIVDVTKYGGGWYVTWLKTLG